MKPLNKRFAIAAFGWVLVAVCTAGRAQFVLPIFEKAGQATLPRNCPSLRYGTNESAYEGPQPFDMLSYKLDLNVPMTSDALSGKVVMRMRLKRNIDSLRLNAVGLSLDTVRVDGLPKMISRDSLNEAFTIILNGTRASGDSLLIEVAYNRLQNFRRSSSRQGYYFFRDSIGLPANLGYTFSEPSDARFWFPCYDQPWEKAQAEVNITVPSGYVAASNGKLAGIMNNGNGTMTWRWVSSQQIATHLMCLTISRFSVSSLPYVKSTGDTIPLQYYSWNSPPFQDSAWTAAFLPTVRQMVGAYAGLFGEYPFEKYGMTTIVPFGYLGMEHQTLTTMNRYYATSHWVVSHELAHQWWGDNVTCGTWADIWLNESFASYAEALWREHLYGFDSLKAYMRDTLSQFQFVSWQGAIYDPVGQGFDLFTRSVYSKGAWVLHTLRGVVGDSVFFNSLRVYQRKFSGKSAITSELQAIVDSVAGRSMSWFFNQWVFGLGWPKYALASSWNADTLTCMILQNQDAGWPTFRMPIRLRAYHGTNHTDFVVQDSMRFQTFKLPIPLHPDSVVLDPDGWILKQRTAFTGVGEEKEIVGEFRLDQNYPNPFNPKTTITFALGKTSMVNLKVYDVLGREVMVLVNSTLSEGIHTAEFDAGDFSSGVYYYRITARPANGAGAAFSCVRKMLVVR